MKRSPVIPWRYWYWTNAEENLFLLDKDQYDWFTRIVEGYYACTPSFSLEA